MTIILFLGSAYTEDVIFTSGATEANNLALFGLAPWAAESDRMHIVTTSIEHKAVLEPLEVLSKRGFRVDYLPVGSAGFVNPDDVRSAVRPDTALVAMMHVNNETGVIQPVAEVAEILADHPAYFVVDAAQSFGKELDHLRNPRIDLIAISGHKIYGPKGIGALVARRRGYRRPPLTPLMYGGGQERGLRPGTVPVPLVAGLGLAAELAQTQLPTRRRRVSEIRTSLLHGLAELSPVVHGDPAHTVPHVLNVSIPGVDGEAAMVALKDLAALSNGSACTSSSREPSHVLVAMGVPPTEIEQALRISWSHLTENVDVSVIVRRLRELSRAS